MNTMSQQTAGKHGGAGGESCGVNCQLAFKLVSSVDDVHAKTHSRCRLSQRSANNAAAESQINERRLLMQHSHEARKATDTAVQLKEKCVSKYPEFEERKEGGSAGLIIEKNIQSILVVFILPLLCLC